MSQPQGVRRRRTRDYSSSEGELSAPSDDESAATDPADVPDPAWEEGETREQQTDRRAHARAERLWRRRRRGVWDPPSRRRSWRETVALVLFGGVVMLGVGFVASPGVAARSGRGGGGGSGSGEGALPHHYYAQDSLGCTLFMTHGSYSVTRPILSYVRSWKCEAYGGDPFKEGADLRTIMEAMVPEETAGFRSLTKVKTLPRSEVVRAAGSEGNSEGSAEEDTDEAERLASPYRLSAKEFTDTYARSETPVVFKSMWRDMFSEGVDSGAAAAAATEYIPWNITTFVKHCGDRGVKPAAYEKEEAPSRWGGMVPAWGDDATMKLSEFVALNDTRAYLHDWALPTNCPELFEAFPQFRIPRYFANDYVQSVEHTTRYREDWPSLFVGPKGSQTGIHADSLGSPAWMLQLKGRKRWRIVKANYSALLYPTAHSYALDLFEPDFKKHRLAGLVDVQEVVLEAGDVLFVPGGALHAVENLDDTVAISSNYVDFISLNDSLAALAQQGTADEAAYYFFRELQRQKMNGALPEYPPNREVGWREFKHQRRIQRAAVVLTDHPDSLLYLIIFMTTGLVFVVIAAWWLYIDLAPGC